MGLLVVANIMEISYMLQELMRVSRASSWSGLIIMSIHGLVLSGTVWSLVVVE